MAEIKHKTILIILRQVNVGFSEEHTIFEKNLVVLTNQLIYLVNVKTMRKIQTIQKKLILCSC